MTRLYLLLQMTLIATSVAAQTLRGTAFTYQGSLGQPVTPAHGNLDMAFALCDAVSGGDPAGPALAFTAAHGSPLAALSSIVCMPPELAELARGICPLWMRSRFRA